jgi:hypothetical protein
VIKKIVHEKYDDDGNEINYCRVGLCECGTEVYLDGFTCPCDGCGRDYNSAGQELAPRSQWGEETGESLGDILRIR